VSAPRSSYDVIVIGHSLGALATGALLARRGFRVVALGHGALPQRYERDGRPLYRRLGALTAHESPAFRRAFAELALLPAVRRRLTALDPAWQVLLPGRRIDVPAAAERRVAEVLREFPEVPRAVEEFYATLAGAEPALDALFGADLSWPPQGFWERRRARALADALPLRPGADLLGAFASDHAFRAFVDAQCRFSGDADPDSLGALRRARSHAGTRVAMLDGDEHDGITQMLLEKILQHGGGSRPRDSVERIVVRRGRAVGVELSGVEEELGASWIVTGLEAAAAHRLTGEPLSRGYGQSLLSARPRHFRYVLNVVVRRAVLPVGMGRRVFAVMDGARPLTEENLLAIEVAPGDGPEATLRVGALLPRALVDAGEASLRRVRARVLAAIARVIPFLEGNTLWVESPHDGLGGDAPSGATSGRAGVAEPMEALEEFTAPGFLGLCGHPLRGDVERLLLPGRQVVPALGVEGELLAALSAARMITRSDPSKERLRVELWSRVES
jgi:hypothetical protein